MGRVLVLDASPIITLAKASLLSVLDEPDVGLTFPTAVAEEILAGPAGDPARRALDAGWGRAVESSPVPTEVLEWGLGAGESAVLAEGRARPGAIVVLDDAEARRAARALGIQVTGTLGLLVRAATYGRLPDLPAAIRALRDAGLWLDEEAIRSAAGRARSPAE